MSKASVTAPVLVQVEDKTYKLIYINLADDGSLYVLFPRKLGYRISKEANIPEIKGEKTISLEGVDEDINSPYISFHPKSKSVHINTSTKEIYKFDAQVINMAEDKSTLSFPLCQIIFSWFSYLDIYSSTKYLPPLTYQSKTLYPPKNLSLEIWVHPAGTYFEWKDLPLHDAREKKLTPIGLFRLNFEKLKLYTCSIAACELKSEIIVKDNVTPGIIVAVFNEKQPYSFELTPIERAS